MNRPPVSGTALTTVSADLLSFDAAEMRALGYWVVDQVIQQFTTRGQGPAVRTGDPVQLRAALGGPVPAEPGDPLAAMQDLVDIALTNMQHTDHPRYFARVPGPSAYPAVLGEWLATGFQAFAGSWLGGSGPTTVEIVVLDWLRQLLGLPEGTQGILLSGGSMANLTGLIAVRNVLGDGVMYLSDQTHSSIARGLRAMGLPPEHVRVLATGEDLRMDAEILRRAVRADLARGLRPLVVIATAGTTNTGAVDPLDELADICAAEDLWLHVDGAYGASAALSATGKSALPGLERADSLVLDPHKWLFQPYDIGALLVRRPGVLDQAFSMNPEYLIDVTAVGAGGIAADFGEVDLRNRSLELSRRSRAIKLWLTFRTYGAETLALAIERGIALAEHAASLLRADGRWQVITAPQLGIVTFAWRSAADGDHARAVTDLTTEGYATLSTTVLHGRSVLRLCTINPATTEADLRGTIERLATSLAG